MIVAFKFTYVGVGSWNGVWTGAGYNYYEIRKYTKSQITNCEALRKIQEQSSESWIYDFRDGWVAKVSGRVVDAKEAAGLRKISDGFGNTWMIDSILKYNAILSDRQIKEREEKLEIAAQ